ncbi:MAG: hypothetical protein ACREJO_06720, partial [Phycisphaerales bacterium]
MPGVAVQAPRRLRPGWYNFSWGRAYITTNTADGIIHLRCKDYGDKDITFESLFGTPLITNASMLPGPSDPRPTEEFPWVNCYQIYGGSDGGSGGGGGWSQPWGAGMGGISINGMGAKRQDLLRPTDIAGPAATTENSTLAASGFKVEDVTDLVVQLPGRSFELTRNFTGSSPLMPIAALGFVAGGGWSLSTDTQIKPFLDLVSYNAAQSTEDPLQDEELIRDDGDWGRMGVAVVLASPMRDSVAFQNFTKYRPVQPHDPPPSGPPIFPSGATTSQKNDLKREFVPLGPGIMRLTATTWTDSVIGTHAAWVLIEPGGGTSIFFRDLETTEDAVSENTHNGDYCPSGMLWQQIDEFGNAWTFRYGPGPDSDSSLWTGHGDEARLRSIYLHGQGESDAKAVVDFFWLNSPAGLSGVSLLKAVTVRRPFGLGSENRQWYRTDAVFYDYTSDLTPEVLGQDDELTTTQLNSLGPVFDSLVQVTRYHAIAAPAATDTTAPVEQDPQISITQYRYFEEESSSVGFTRQIRAVYSPEQIEMIARKDPTLGDSVLSHWTASSSNPDAVRLEAVASKLLTLPDSQTISGTGLTLADFASKLTTYNTGAWMKGRPNTEYSMPGPAGHTKKVEFTYEEASDRDFVAIHGLSIVDNGTTYRRNWGLLGSVTKMKEFTRGTETVGGESASTWRPRRQIRHRSEDRELFTLAYVNRPSGSTTSSLEKHIFVSALPYTVAEEITELGVDASVARQWVTKYEFDQYNRPKRTFRPSAVSVGTNYTGRLVDADLTLLPNASAFVESAEYTDEDGDLDDLDNSRKFLTSTTMRIKERYFGSDLSSSRQTIAKFEYNTIDSKRGDLVTKEIKYRVAGTTSDDEKEVADTLYTYRTVSTALGDVGIKPIATATVISERELPSELGPPIPSGQSSVSASSTYTLNALGEITSVAHTGNPSVSEYEYDPINGATTLARRTGTGVSNPLVSTAVYDVSGRRLAVRTADGVTAAWWYTQGYFGESETDIHRDLPGLLRSSSDTPSTGTPRIPVPCVVQFPQQVSSGVFSGSVSVEWYNAAQLRWRVASLEPGTLAFLSDGRFSVPTSATPLGQAFSRSEASYFA